MLNMPDFSAPDFHRTSPRIMLHETIESGQHQKSGESLAQANDWVTLQMINFLVK